MLSFVFQLNTQHTPCLFSKNAREITHLPIVGKIYSTDVLFGSSMDRSLGLADDYVTTKLYLQSTKFIKPQRPLGAALPFKHVRQLTPNQRPRAMCPCASQPRGVAILSGLSTFADLRPTTSASASPARALGFPSSLDRPLRIPETNCTHIVICSMDTNRCGSLARFRLVGSSTPTGVYATD